MLERKLIIIGSGPAGLTAGIYAARANLKPLIISGVQPGGQLTQTTEVENYPGFPEGILGPKLMEQFRTQAQKFGAEIVDGQVDFVDFTAKPFKVKVAATEYQGETVIIATGASSLWLGLPKEQELIGHGVSSCATCDGFFYRNKDVLVVGGGDSAMEEATYLTKFARSVTVVHRRGALNASHVMQERARNNEKISFVFNHIVDALVGDGQLNSVKLKNVNSGEITEKEVQGMFVAIGHKPNTDVFSGQIDLDVKGYIKVHDQTKTNVEGVFVAGDVQDYRYRQAITASGWGCMAAMDAEKYLMTHEA